MSRDRDSSRRSASGAEADRILEQALKHELRAAGTPPAGACLDAETLGAWTDGALDPIAVAAAEAHVSSCARCQAMVGTMLKSASTLGTPGTLGSVRTQGTLSLWRWWLAPMAAGLTAVTLWMVIPEQQQVAVAPPQDKAASQAPVAGEPVPPAAPAKEATREQFAERDNRTAPAARVDQAKEKSRDELKEEARARPAQEREAPADAAAPAAPPAAPSSATATRQAPAELGALQKNAPRIVAPPGIEITHQSAPSDSVCWFVGRAGLVLLTTDAGATFTRVDLGEPLDLAGVSATDARIATITTVSGRRFRTEDGGRTWQPF